MALLRASDFCRRPSSPHKVRLKVLPLDDHSAQQSLFRPSLSNDKEESLVVFASLEFLRRASLISGSVVWVERFRQDEHAAPSPLPSYRTIARIQVLPEPEQVLSTQDLDSSIDPTILFISTMVAVNLHMYNDNHHPAIHHYGQVQVWEEADIPRGLPK